jgi:hypothetical protein
MITRTDHVPSYHFFFMKGYVMAGSCLCVTCANLPIKARGVATSERRCPECNAELGITSYGSAFRIGAVKARPIFTPSLVQGMLVGILLFSIVLLQFGLDVLSTQQAPPPPVIPFAQAAPPAAAPRPFVPHELAHVPEVGLTPLSGGTANAAQLAQRHTQFFAEAKDLNGMRQDGFLLAQIEKQPELRGLPFMMGDACRLKPAQAQQFQTSVRAVRDAMDNDVNLFAQAHDGPGNFWGSYASADRPGIDSAAGIAALTQILGPEATEVRVGFMAKLAKSTHPDAIKVLTKTAIFDAIPEVRWAAVKALKDRPRNADSTEVLMYGMRYPMAEVASRAAQAIVALDRKDLVPQLVALLGEAAPGEPVETIVDDKRVCTVREVVRINHHRNCLLCHAPARTGSAEEVPALVPTPGAPFPSSAREYYGERNFATSPAVRADTTYLRQDFSILMPVADAAPWPEMQRFDFVVRTRVVEGQALAQLQQTARARAKGETTMHQEASAHALRALTGKDAVPTQAAWQRVLGMSDQ